MGMKISRMQGTTKYHCFRVFSWEEGYEAGEGGGKSLSTYPSELL